MSDEKDTAVSPEETAKEPEASKVESEDKVTTPTKPKDYVLLQHLQRDRGTRSLRAARGGHRRQGVLLEDGTRIRQRAYRYTELSVANLVSNHQSLLEHVREGRLAVFAPDETPLSYDEVVSLVGGELQKSDVKSEVNESSLKEQVQESSTGVKDEEVNPPISPPSKDRDATRPDGELSATLAAVDMAEESKKLASPEQEEAAEELTEGDLLKKNRAELNKLAIEYGVKHPEKMGSKQAVVEAIFAAAEKE